MRVFRILTMACCIAMFCGTQDATAKNKMVPKVYAFGVSTSFNDSTVYITDIQDIDSAWIDSKTNFLKNREDYSYQMNSYFDALGQKHRTCVIFCEVKRAKLAKKFERIKKKYMGKDEFNVKNLTDKDFHFTAITPDEEYEEETANPPMPEMPKGKMPEKPNGVKPMPGNGPRPQK